MKGRPAHRRTSQPWLEHRGRFRGVMRFGIFLVCISTLTVQTSAFARVRQEHIVQGNDRGPFWGRSAHVGKSRLALGSSKSFSSSRPSGSSDTATSTALALRGGEVSEIATSAYDWCTNLGNPSALVAGAVVATMYENIGSGALDIQKEDTKMVRFGKRLTRVLLLSAFALEVMSIFVTTVTGTMLLSKTEDDLDALVAVTKNTTPLSFLYDNFEFEYLSARIAFLQGLLNWIMAIAITHILPNGESREMRPINKFIGSSLILSMSRHVINDVMMDTPSHPLSLSLLQTAVTLMLAFYNSHLSFYGNYFLMLSRWVHVVLKRFVLVWPPRPSILLTVPCLVKTAMFGYEAFVTVDREEAVPSSDKNEDVGVGVISQ